MSRHNLIKKCILVTSLITAWHFTALSQIEKLRYRIDSICQHKRALIGVAILGLENHDSLTVNSNAKLPMQSVYKFHIALVLLKQIDQGRYSLREKIFVSRAALPTGTWSPLRDRYPKGNVKVSLSELITYMVSQSDNNACDIIINLLGGTSFIQNYIHSLGITGCSIRSTEQQMHSAWEVQYTNWTFIWETVRLLQMYYDQKLLHPLTHNFLWKIMAETTTGQMRIKRGAQPGGVVAHKTGTSDTNIEGMTGAINDIGIVGLPNGQHIAISVFVTDTFENTTTNEKIIADITSVACDYFLMTYK